MSNNRKLKLRYNAKRNVKVDPELTKFWGKPPSPTDLKICESLGWAKFEDAEQPSWRLALDTQIFAGPIYRNGKPAEFICDIVLEEFLVNRGLACLEPFFQRNDGRLELRALLTLTVLVLEGQAAFRDNGAGITFFSLTDLPGEFETQPDDGDPVSEMLRIGNACCVLGEKGEDLMIATPKGAWCGITDAQAWDDDIDEILDELQARGLMRRALGTDGIRRWQPTKAGVAAGLNRRDVPAFDVLAGLDVVGFEKKEAFNYFVRAETPVKPQLPNADQLKN